MRQDQRFPAQVESLLYDKPVRLWRLISENETKCSNFEQNRFTKSQKATGVRIVLGQILRKFPTELKSLWGKLQLTFFEVHTVEKTLVSGEIKDKHDEIFSLLPKVTLATFLARRTAFSLSNREFLVKFRPHYETFIE